MPILTGPRAAPRSGQTSSLVILVHGYGADGNDLFGLSGPLARYMPDTAFRSPNAPERCRVNPMGYQWFPIPWLDGSQESEMAAGFRRSADLLDRYITEAMAEEGVGPDRTALVGFSQGTMMALHVGLRRAVPPAAIVGYSGVFVLPDNAEPEAVAGEIVARPPVLLVHGAQDDLIPAQALFQSAQALAALAVPVEWHLSPGVGHGIDQEGLRHGGSFLARRFGA
jgi:phospholipase/carboxylesterase